MRNRNCNSGVIWDNDDDDDDGGCCGCCKGLLLWLCIFIMEEDREDDLEDVYTSFPIPRPANFLEMRMGAQCNFCAK